MSINNLTRRDFVRSTTTTAAGLAFLGLPNVASSLTQQSATQPETAAAPPPPDIKLRVLSIGVIGTIGGADRNHINAHPNAAITGLCDVDAKALEKAASEHPDAFTCADYREAFENHGDKFDAVIVATPDHSHCSIMTLALARGKHVYGQKPLVQQLEELEILGQAVRARPNLVTQTGAQRIQSPARRAAVDILKSGTLGRVVEVHIAFGGGALNGGHYFADGTLGEPCDPPEGFDYDLWLCGNEYKPCRPQMVQRQWRSWWNYGGGQITDWVVHLTDVLFYAFPDELHSPTHVCSRTPSRDLTYFHADRVLSTLAYPVQQYDPNLSKFANSNCNFYFYDSNMQPDRAHLGVGEGEWPSGILTIVVCENGTLVLAPSGPIEIWRDGVKTDGLQMPDLPTYESFNHWHAWVDKAIGIDTPHHWMPFEIGLRCTEAGLLAVKAAKYPGQLLEWDRGSLTFPNHEGATNTIVKRTYRPGFEPARLGVDGVGISG